MADRGDDSDDPVFDLAGAVEGRPAPAPRPYLPDLHGQKVLARCIDVRVRFLPQFGRLEVHLIWHVEEGPAEGERVWMKFNDYEKPGTGCYLYRWYRVIVREPKEGSPMPPNDFLGATAMVKLRGVESDRPYTIVDAAAVPPFPDATP